MTQDPQPQPQPQPPKSNGTAQLLSTLAQSGDRMIQLAVLILVGLSGLGNFFSTRNASQENLSGQQAIKAVVREQISDIHRWQQANYNWVRQSVDEFHKNSQDSAESRKLLEKLLRDLDDGIEAQTQMLKNQTKMLENQNVQMANDTKILDQIGRALAPLTLERAYPTPIPKQQ